MCGQRVCFWSSLNDGWVLTSCTVSGSGPHGSWEADSISISLAGGFYSSRGKCVFARGLFVVTVSTCQMLNTMSCHSLSHLVLASVPASVWRHGSSSKQAGSWERGHNKCRVQGSVKQLPCFNRGHLSLFPSLHFSLSSLFLLPSLRTWSTCITTASDLTSKTTSIG